MNFIKHIFKKHLQAVLSLGFIIVFATTLHIFANGWPYAPGATLNPGCLPTDPTCVVTIIAGSDTQVQFNDGGAFGGDADFAWNKTGHFLTAGFSTNIQLGTDAGVSLTSGTYNIVIGTEALYSSETGANNIALGFNALYQNTTGAGNFALGTDTLHNNTEGVENTAIGYEALELNTTGNSNIAMGSNTLIANLTGNNNIAIGDSALAKVLGSSNTAIGYYAGNKSTGSGSVFLGNYAGKYETGFNAFYIDNQDRTNTAGDKAKALMYGVFDADPANQILTINGQLKISQGVPGAGKVLTSDATGLATWETPAGGASIVQEITVDLTADQIKTANSVPINTGISVGAGEAIEVVSASMKYIFNTTPFDNPLNFYLIIDGMINTQVSCQDASFVGAVADYFLKCLDVGYDASSDQLVDGADLMVKTDADSVAGDGTAKIYIAYRIITL